MNSIYIHIPYCKQKCTYCDFHFSVQLKNKSRLVDAICKEINQRSSDLNNNNIHSIYFGGGTPSLLNQAELDQIFNAINQTFKIDAASEITLEANPDDIHKKNLSIWEKSGINRLSIGLQSFNDEELKWMNRTHQANQGIASVLLAQDSGFTNLTIDLIYGSKFQDLLSWEKTLQKAIQLNTPHISAYHLTIEEKTALGINFKKKIEPAVSDELGESQFLMLSDILSKNGFKHYEISNFAKNGFEAVHNSNYWKRNSYLGFGPSAHSYNGKQRQWNISNNEIYIQKIESGEQFFETEELSTNNLYNEYIMTGLRSHFGCNLNEIENLFGESFKTHFSKSIIPYSNYFIVTNKQYQLNLQGWLIADKIASELFLVDSIQ